MKYNLKMLRKHLDDQQAPYTEQRGQYLSDFGIKVFVTFVAGMVVGAIIIINL